MNRAVGKAEERAPDQQQLWSDYSIQVRSNQARPAQARAPLLLLLILGLFLWGATLPTNLLRSAATPTGEFTAAPSQPFALAPTAEQSPLPHLAIFTFDPISLNRADSQTLAFLPGIGPALAARIIEYRQNHGPFQSIEELQRVPGIGPKTLERLRPLAAP